MDVIIRTHVRDLFTVGAAAVAVSVENMFPAC